MATSPSAKHGAGERLFHGLGRGLVRHPWYPIVFWIVLLAITLPFLGRLASETTNSSTNLPSSAPSAVAAAELARLYPNSSGGAESLLLVSGSNVTGPTGQAAVVGLAANISADRALTHVAAVSTIYSSYARILAGAGALASSSIFTTAPGNLPLPTEVNGTAQEYWGPVSRFVDNLEELALAHPSLPSSSFNAAAYNETVAELGGNATLEGILAWFYDGTGGFNTSQSCGFTSLPSTQVAVCADAVNAAIQPASPDNDSPVVSLVLGQLGVGNFTLSFDQGKVIAAVIGPQIGLPGPLVLEAYVAATSGVSTPGQWASWAANISDTVPVSSWPLPAPPSLWGQFVDPTDSATIIVVEFTIPDSVTVNGANPVFEDVDAINALLPPALATYDPGHTLVVQQTGGAPLDSTENSVLSASLAIVLPLTILALVLITILYFRAPLAPAISFGGLGVALALGLGGVVLIGTLLGPVDSTSLTLATTFVLGVGTDYSIFMIARYREELRKGVTPSEALVTTVTWAGQSIATSGTTAVIATLALAFSGVPLLDEWGEVLSLAVLIAVLVSLTMVPAMLVLVGPRVFWPYTGERFRQQAAEDAARRTEERTYFYQVARRVRRRPKTVVGLVLLVSIPLFYVALTAPISYDFYGQIPGGHPATDGLTALDNDFGPGWAFPTVLLVTFHAPLMTINGPDLSEFSDLSNLTTLIATTPGVASVSSPTGLGGATLSTWQNYSGLPVGPKTLLSGAFATFVGTDGQTVRMTVTPASGGLSASGVALLQTLKTEVGGFEGSHADVSNVAYGGGASETSDIQAQVSLATERMALAVSIGLMIVLFAVLRSAYIPPMAVATIGLSIGWAWGITNLVLGNGFGLPLFYFAPTVLFILILGLGIDYNIFLLTRVREERFRGRTSDEATVQAVAATGGIITAAAIILAAAFAILVTGQFILLQAIGFAVATAVLLDAMIVRTYLVPASLFLLGERVWRLPGRRRAPPSVAAEPLGPTGP